LGLTTIFTSKADLSGVTGEQNLHVNELVQHVGVRVDEGFSSQSALTATNSQRSGANDPTVVDKSMTINRPFMFVVRDVIDDIILAAGKVVDVGKATNDF
jgi:serine protease inhibitor